MLDRIDALLFAGAAAYYVIAAFGASSACLTHRATLRT